MDDTIKTQIGSLRIIDRLGSGAMGVVYRAQDSRLDRHVAVKVLPDVLVKDHQRLARFKREAKLLASLNHPSIAIVHEIGCVDGTNFLVMELVEGETLADLLQRGVLPLEKALPIFAQIADALEYAHDQHIVHRDLKPANVMVTEDGAVKVLDFGLAKALDTPDTTSGNSETRGVDSAVATGAGQVVGTPAYMSPEQASGQKLDKRVDIWAFGCCLYEALVGQRPFIGDNATQLLARILEREPDWEALSSSLPARVRVLIWRCLQKDPRRRLRDIGEARFELSESTTATSNEIASFGITPTPTVGVRKNSLYWCVAGLVIGAVVPCFLMLPGVIPKRPASPKALAIENGDAVVRSTHNVKFDQAEKLHLLSHLGACVPAVAISPDGMRVAYVGTKGDRQQLYVVHRTMFSGGPLAGTDGAMMPFFAPDGNSIGFFTRNELKAVPVNGGSSRTLCETRNGVGGCWAEDGTIYFAEEEGHRISSINARGGRKMELLERALPIAVPQLLPDDKGLLVVGLFEGGVPRSFDHARILHIPFDAGKLKQPEGFLTHGYSVQYLRSGHIALMRGDSLWAAALDLQEMKVIGEPKHMVSGVMALQTAFSANGDLAYIPGRDNWMSSPVWIDRKKVIQELPIEPQEYGTFDLSNDNKRLAIQVNGVDSQVTVYSLDSGRSSRLTEIGASAGPVWTKNDGSLAYAWYSNEQCTIALTRIETSRPPEPVLPPVQGGFVVPTSTSAGDEIAYIASSPLDGTMDIRVVSIAEDRQDREFLATRFNEWSPAISPDGKWIAYTSDRDGQYQIYVRPYPGKNEDERFWKVSGELGEEPIWSPVGEELFYRSGSRIMSVRYAANGAEFVAEDPTTAVETRFVNVGLLSYDVSNDGKRFLILKPAFDDTDLTEIRVVQNWMEELRKVTLDSDERGIPR